jgi:DNA gyrase/topoisomerase IV subunit B
VKSKYKGWNIQYYKGLGSMETEDWEMILSGKTDTLIPILDDDNMKDTLELLFGPSAEDRKEWLLADNA